MNFLGRRRDATRIMSAFDVFTLASQWEGLPVALMEALAIGLPIVATRVGGVDEAVGTEEFVTLVPAKDPDALALAFESVLTDETRRTAMAGRSRELADRFNIRRAVATIEQTYRDVARGARPMNVLHVITDTDRRGAQVFALDLQDALLRLGHDSETVALAPGDQRPALDVESAGAEPVSPHDDPSAPAANELRRHHGRPRLRHADGLRHSGHRPPAGPSCTARSATHGSGPRVGPGDCEWQRSCDPPSQVVALSETDRTDLREHLRFPDSRITVIPNGVPIAGFAPATPEQRVAAKKEFDIQSEAFVLLSISALVPEKGVDVAIRATSAIEECHLLVVGDGPERTALEQLAADVAPGRVTFTGALSEPLEAYRAADVVLLPSLGGDTMPATLIEAGLCGLPSVSTPIGAIEEIVLDGRTGFIVPPGDEVALVTALETLRSDSDLAAAMGLTARSHCVDTFAIDRVGEQWADTMSAVIAAGGRDDMRVMAVVDSTSGGGAETSLAAMAPHLIDAGVDLQVAYFHDREGVKERLDAAGVTLFHVPPGSNRLVTIRRLRKLIRAQRPDLVHTMVFEADIAGRTAAFLSRTPVVSSIINEMYGPEHEATVSSKVGFRLAWLSDAATARFVRRFHAITETVADVMAPRLRVDRRSIDVIYRGRDPEEFPQRTPARRMELRHSLGIDDERPVLLATSRQEPQKGLDVFIEALPTTVGGVPDGDRAACGSGRREHQRSEAQDRRARSDRTHSVPRPSTRRRRPAVRR